MRRRVTVVVAGVLCAWPTIQQMRSAAGRVRVRSATRVIAGVASGALVCGIAASTAATAAPATELEQFPLGTRPA